MLALLDVNALIARSDPAHQFHGKIREWFSICVDCGFKLIVGCHHRGLPLKP